MRYLVLPLSDTIWPLLCNPARHPHQPYNIAQDYPRRADSSCCTTREWEAKINWGCVFAIVSSQKTVLVAHGHGCIFHRAACHRDNKLEKYFSFFYGKIQTPLALVVHPKMKRATRFAPATADITPEGEYVIPHVAANFMFQSLWTATGERSVFAVLPTFVFRKSAFGRFQRLLAAAVFWPILHQQIRKFPS